MLKLTSLSGALAALVTASVLSGCGGGNAEPLNGPPMTSSSHAQATTSAAAPAKDKAAVVAQAARTADAAAAYLRIITRFNIANHEYKRVTGAAGRPQAVPASYRAAAQAFSSALTNEVAELRAYHSWPQSVKPRIDQFIAQKVTLASSHLQMSAVTAWDSWNSAGDRARAGGVETSRLSALIRQDLGLPPVSAL